MDQFASELGLKKIEKFARRALTNDVRRANLY